MRAQLIHATVSDQYPVLRVRFSAGLTRFRSGEPIHKTIERADNALYQAKAGGRDRCEIALEPPP